MKKILVLLAVFMLLGELEEIKYQTVVYGENIKQYAIVKVLQNGNAYTKPCEDCICYITLTDNQNKKYLNNKLMQKLNEGLYGYNCNQQEIPLGNYIFFANCTSSLYTGGIAISDLNVKDNIIPPISNKTILPSCEKYDSCIPGLGNFYCMPDAITCSKDSLLEKLDSLINSILKLIDWLTSLNLGMIIPAIFFGIFDTLASVLLAPFIIMVGLFFTLFILFLLTMEMIAIGYVVFSAHPKNGFEYVTSWFVAHAKIMNVVKDIIFRIV